VPSVGERTTRASPCEESGLAGLSLGALTKLDGGQLEVQHIAGEEQEGAGGNVLGGGDCGGRPGLDTEG
jgi:hypothetical protein